MMRGMWLGLLTIALAACWAGKLPADDLLVEHARIHTMVDGEAVIDDGQVLVIGNAIAAIGHNLAGPAGIAVVDARGQALTPGLVAAASQLGLTETGGNDHSTDHTTSGQNLGAGFDVSLAVNSNSELLRVARADGLTYAVTLPGGSSDPLFKGLGALLRLGDSADVVLQPKLAGFAQVGAASSAAAGGSRAAQWLLLQTALQAARKPADTGSTAAASSIEELNKAALRGLVNGDRPLLLDVRRESDIRQALALKQQFGLRLIILGGSEAWRVAPELAAAQVPVILDAGSFLPSSVDEWGVRADAAKILQDAGVLIAFYPGFSLYYSLNAGSGARESAGYAVANGLDWEDGLRGLTINPARMFGFEQQAGTLAVGRPASLVIWDGDPLEPASAPVMVLVEGKAVSLETRQSLLRDRYHPQAQKRDWPPAYH